MEQMSFSKDLIVEVDNLSLVTCCDKAIQYSLVMIIVCHNSQGEYVLYDCRLKLKLFCLYYKNNFMTLNSDNINANKLLILPSFGIGRDDRFFSIKIKFSLSCTPKRTRG